MTETKMRNETTVSVRPVKDEQGVWRFDDAALNLQAEPFVGTANTLIDLLLGDASVWHCEVTASTEPFEGAVPLVYHHPDPEGGSWYTFYLETRDRLLNLQIWLCPVLNLYFGESPDMLYFDAQPIHHKGIDNDWRDVT